MTEIVFSSQHGGFLPGRVYQNPKFFEGFTPDTTSVIVVGDYPNVVQAAKELKLPCRTVKKASELKGLTDNSESKSSRKAKVDVSAIDYDNTNYRDLRKIALQCNPDADVKSKLEAIDVIENYRKALEEAGDIADERDGDE